MAEPSMATARLQVTGMTCDLAGPIPATIRHSDRPGFDCLDCADNGCWTLRLYSPPAYQSRHGFTPPGSTAKASLTLARLLQPLRDRGPVRTNAYTYTVQRASLLPVEKRELVADKLHTGHAEEPKRTQSKPRGSCRRSRGRKRGVALRRYLTRDASSTAPRLATSRHPCPPR